MTNRSPLSPEQAMILEKIILEFLGSDRTQAWIFGSYAKGIQSRASDLDVLIDTGEAIPFATLAELREKLEDSDLPFRVDVVDARSCTEAFLQGALKSAIRLLPSQPCPTTPIGS